MTSWASNDTTWRDYPTSKLARCAHHHCRTTLTEDAAVQCPHGLGFCDGCTWEEVCHECSSEATEARAVA